MADKRDDKEKMPDGYIILGHISNTSTFGVLVGLILTIWFGIIGLKVAGTCLLITIFMYPGLKEAGWYDRNG